MEVVDILAAVQGTPKKSMGTYTWVHVDKMLVF